MVEIEEIRIKIVRLKEEGIPNSNYGTITEGHLDGRQDYNAGVVIRFK